MELHRREDDESRHEGLPELGGGVAAESKCNDQRAEADRQRRSEKGEVEQGLPRQRGWRQELHVGLAHVEDGTPGVEDPEQGCVHGEGGGGQGEEERQRFGRDLETWTEALMVGGVPEHGPP